MFVQVWEGLNVVKTGRQILGATDPKDSAPGTIRGDLCIQVGRYVDVTLSLLKFNRNLFSCLIHLNFAFAATSSTDLILLNPPRRKSTSGSSPRKLLTGSLLCPAGSMNKLELSAQYFYFVVPNNLVPVFLFTFESHSLFVTCIDITFFCITK